MCSSDLASGKVFFTAGRGPMNRAVKIPFGDPIHTEEATVEVAVSSVDQLIHDIPAPLLWKVDVEGYEPEVLKGAVSSLRNPGLKAVLLEADTLALQDTMSQAGFSRFVYDPFTRQLHPLGPTTPAGSSHNQLWIRDLA